MGLQQQMLGMVSRNRTVNGTPTSLWDLGYTDFGLDDAWQKCGKYGPHDWTYHDANGRPVVDTHRFPSLLDMTSFGHNLSLTVGWYGNNCICRDTCSEDICYYGDVNAAMDYGFDSIKLDGCGAQLDLYKYETLLNATGKAFLIENCHWGTQEPPFPRNQSDCPYSYYRTSGDIEASYASTMKNLQTVIKHADANVSFPGCFAFPDALEVGCKDGPHGPSGDPGLSFVEARSHFNSWCIISSPLILAHDMLNATLNNEIWPIISNKEAIAINQAYWDFSGSLFKSGGSAGALPAFQYWYKPLSATSTAVLLLNHANATQTLSLTFADVPRIAPPGPNGYAIRDVNAHAGLGNVKVSYAAPVVSHDSLFLTLTPA